MKKIKKIFAVLMIMIIAFSSVAFASKNIPEEVEKTLDSYIDCLEDEDEDAFLYIDSKNEELHEKTKQFLHEIGSFNYKIKKVEENNGRYTVEITIDAQGRGNSWSISGISVEFTIKEIDGEYIITDTTLFENIGMENVLKFIGKMFATIGVVFLVIVVFIIVLIIVIVKKLPTRKDIATNTPSKAEDKAESNFDNDNL